MILGFDESVFLQPALRGPANYFSILVLFILLGLALHLWPYRKAQGAGWQIAILILKAVWLVDLLVGSNAVRLEQKIVCLQIAAELGFFAGYAWLRFLYAVSGYERNMSRRVDWALRAVLTFFGILVISEVGKRALWTSLRVDNGGFHASRSLLGLGITLAVYSLVAYTAVFNTRWALRNAGLRRLHAWMFLLPSFFSLTGQIVYREMALDNVAPCSLGFCISGLITIWAFHRWRIYSILPLAHESLIRGMSDGLLVVDTAGYIVDMNAPVRTIFQNSGITVGSSVLELAKAWPEAMCPEPERTVCVWEASRQNGDKLDFYQITMTALRTDVGHVLGRVLVLRDTTAERVQQNRIVEQERALAMMRERERLGRELHDGQGQVWSYISLTAQMLRTMLARQKYAQADEELARLIGAVQEIHTNFRESIDGLRGSSSVGLVHALESQLEWYRKQCGMDVDLELLCEWRHGMLTPTAESHLLRIVQEAMINVRKSARACKVRVRMEREEETLLVCIEDDGCGFNVEETQDLVGHHGLGIMRERAREMGGSLSIASRPGEGTIVCLHVPLAGDGFEKAITILEQES